MTHTSAVTRDAIADTHGKIAPFVRKTPVIVIDPADFGLAGQRLVFKLEFLQHTGSFKVRGAFANLCLRDVPEAGVTAASGGNHGAAVAFAARARGHRAKIFVPAISSPAKQALIRGCGAELVVGGERYDDALAGCDAHAAATGALKIHAFEQVETMLGQGTVGLELEEQAPDIDTLLVATGGGGLIGGISAWYDGRVKVVSVEPELAPTLHNALKEGAPVESPAGGIAADSLAPRRVGSMMFEIARCRIAEAVLVPDPAIRDAQERLWQHVRLVTEPGGATALAALLCGAYKPGKDERVAVLLCGANTTAVSF